jgi:glycosyltransferase involved in cell wall biosynthesis
MISQQQRSHGSGAVSPIVQPIIDPHILVILIAPNVGEQMGGEAMKALQIFRELKKQHPNTIQITHGRNRPELSERLGIPDVFYVPDTTFALILWRSRILRAFIDPWFCKRAVRLAEKIAEDRHLVGAKVVIHQTEPNSPVMPRTISKKHLNVFGPINGNIYYPVAFRHHESLKTRLRRRLHFPLQWLNRVMFTALANAHLIFAAGGERTLSSLRAAGCHGTAVVESLDCGISDAILDQSRIRHCGINYRFVHYGRLVFHKGTVLIIESLAKTQHPICLDIIGRGPELERCKQLTTQLGLAERVKFVDWVESHGALLNSLKRYRAAVLPSIEDANGIVVQEAMAMGLPAICLNWGGPRLLIQDGISGLLIEPKSRDYIISKMAEFLDRLAIDDTFADKLSLQASKSAETWRWSNVITSWLSHYRSIMTKDALLAQ